MTRGVEMSDRVHFSGRSPEKGVQPVDSPNEKSKPSRQGSHGMPPVRIQPGKLLHSKWTALQPRDREKHWLVTRILDPEQPANRWEWIVIEAVHSRRSQTIRWRDLQDSSVWRQGWH